jgi:hypothetical protein
VILAAIERAGIRLFKNIAKCTLSTKTADSASEYEKTRLLLLRNYYLHFFGTANQRARSRFGDQYFLVANPTTICLSTFGHYSLLSGRGRKNTVRPTLLVCLYFIHPKILSPLTPGMSSVIA